MLPVATFAWVVGINTTLSIFVKPLYSFGQVQLGAFYTTPIVAAILGQIIGHFLHDALATHYLRHHDGKFEPEARFRAIWISQPFMIAGLVILGFALQRDWHFMVTAVGWGMYVFGESSHLVFVYKKAQCAIVTRYNGYDGRIASLHA